jgi:hypothetical protein
MNDNSFARQNTGRKGMGRAATLRDRAPDPDGAITRERTSSAIQEAVNARDRSYTVEGLAPTKLPDNVSDWLCHQAMLHMLGQHADISNIQAHFLLRVMYDRPEVIPMTTWFRSASDPNSGVSGQLRRTFVRKELSAHKWRDMDRDALVAELAQITQVCKDFTPQIVALCKLQYNISADQYEELTAEKIFTPIAAAGYMMATRQLTEHVVLTPQILRWANQMPPLRHPEGKATYVEPFPAIAPEAAHEYSKIELLVRRAQRLYFRYMTSAQCHVLIHQSQDDRRERRA